MRGDLGVQGTLKLNSLGTVTVLTVWLARPALLTSAASKALRQLRWLRRMRA